MDFSKLQAELDGIEKELDNAKNDRTKQTFCTNIQQILWECVNNKDLTFQEKLELYKNTLQLYTNHREQLDKYEDNETDSLGQAIFLQCARLVLGIDFHQLDEEKDEKKAFVQTVSSAYSRLQSCCIGHVFLVLQYLMINYWSHPTLVAMMHGQELEQERALQFLRSGEYPDIVRLRVDILVEGECEIFALNLCRWCVKSPEFEKDSFIWKTFLLLLYKQGELEEFHTRCGQLPCCQAVEILQNAALDLYTDAVKSQAILLMTQTFLLQDWVKPEKNCCTKELVKFWLLSQRHSEEVLEDFLESVDKIVRLSSTPDQLCLLLETMGQLFEDQFLDYCTDVSLRAARRWRHLLDSAKIKRNEIEAEGGAMGLARACAAVGKLYEKHEQMCLSCLMTSFYLEPTEESYQKLEVIFDQITTKPSDKPHAPPHVDKFTYSELFEVVERSRSASFHPMHGWKDIQDIAFQVMEEAGYKYDASTHRFHKLEVLAPIVKVKKKKKRKKSTARKGDKFKTVTSEKNQAQISGVEGEKSDNNTQNNLPGCSLSSTTATPVTKSQPKLASDTGKQSAKSKGNTKSPKTNLDCRLSTPVVGEPAVLQVEKSLAQVLPQKPRSPSSADATRVSPSRAHGHKVASSDICIVNSNGSNRPLSPGRAPQTLSPKAQSLKQNLVPKVATPAILKPLVTAGMECTVAARSQVAGDGMSGQMVTVNSAIKPLLPEVTLDEVQQVLSGTQIDGAPPATQTFGDEDLINQIANYLQTSSVSSSLTTQCLTQSAQAISSASVVHSGVTSTLSQGHVLGQRRNAARIPATLSLLSTSQTSRSINSSALISKSSGTTGVMLPSTQAVNTVNYVGSLPLSQPLNTSRVTSFGLNANQQIPLNLVAGHNTNLVTSSNHTQTAESKTHELKIPKQKVQIPGVCRQLSVTERTVTLSEFDGSGMVAQSEYNSQRTTNVSQVLQQLTVLSKSSLAAKKPTVNVSQRPIASIKMPTSHQVSRQLTPIQPSRPLPIATTVNSPRSDFLSIPAMTQQQQIPNQRLKLTQPVVVQLSQQASPGLVVPSVSLSSQQRQIPPQQLTLTQPVVVQLSQPASCIVQTCQPYVPGSIPVQSVPFCGQPLLSQANTTAYQQNIPVASTAITPQVVNSISQPKQDALHQQKMSLTSKVPKAMYHLKIAPDGLGGKKVIMTPVTEQNKMEDILPYVYPPNLPTNMLQASQSENQVSSVITAGCQTTLNAVSGGQTASLMQATSSGINVMGSSAEWMLNQATNSTPKSQSCRASLSETLSNADRPVPACKTLHSDVSPLSKADIATGTSQLMSGIKEGKRKQVVLKSKIENFKTQNIAESSKMSVLPSTQSLVQNSTQVSRTKQTKDSSPEIDEVKQYSLQKLQALQQQTAMLQEALKQREVNLLKLHNLAQVEKPAQLQWPQQPLQSNPDQPSAPNASQSLVKMSSRPQENIMKIVKTQGHTQKVSQLQTSGQSQTAKSHDKLKFSLQQNTNLTPKQKMQVLNQIVKKHGHKFLGEKLLTPQQLQVVQQQLMKEINQQANQKSKQPEHTIGKQHQSQLPKQKSRIRKQSPMQANPMDVLKMMDGLPEDSERSVFSVPEIGAEEVVSSFVASDKKSPVANNSERTKSKKSAKKTTTKKTKKDDICKKVTAPVRKIVESRVEPESESSESSSEEEIIEYQYKCKYCSKGFETMPGRRRHQEWLCARKDDNSCFEEDRVECPLCAKLLTSKTGLRRHLRRLHPEENIVDVHQLSNNVKIPDGIALKECSVHLTMLPKDEVNPSTTPTQRHTMSANHSSKLQERLSDEYESDLEEFVEWKESVLTRSDSPVILLGDVAETDQRTCLCDLCGDIFTCVDQLAHHYQTEHKTALTAKENMPSIDPHLVCEICGKMFLNVKAKAGHKANHTKLGEFVAPNRRKPSLEIMKESGQLINSLEQPDTESDGDITSSEVTAENDNDSDYRPPYNQRTYKESDSQSAEEQAIDSTVSRVRKKSSDIAKMENEHAVQTPMKVMDSKPSSTEQVEDDVLAPKCEKTVVHSSDFTDSSKETTSISSGLTTESDVLSETDDKNSDFTPAKSQTTVRNNPYVSSEEDSTTGVIDTCTDGYLSSDSSAKINREHNPSEIKQAEGNKLDLEKSTKVLETVTKKNRRVVGNKGNRQNKSEMKWAKQKVGKAKRDIKARSNKLKKLIKSAELESEINHESDKINSRLPKHEISEQNRFDKNVRSVAKNDSNPNQRDGKELGTVNEKPTEEESTGLHQNAENLPMAEQNSTMTSQKLDETEKKSSDEAIATSPVQKEDGTVVNSRKRAAARRASMEIKFQLYDDSSETGSGGISDSDSSSYNGDSSYNGESGFDSLSGTKKSRTVRKRKRAYFSSSANVNAAVPAKTVKNNMASVKRSGGNREIKKPFFNKDNQNMMKVTKAVKEPLYLQPSSHAPPELPSPTQPCTMELVECGGVGMLEICAYECQACLLNFDSKEVCVAHQRTSCGLEYGMRRDVFYQCKGCMTVNYKTKEACRHHIMRVCGRSAEKYICQWCHLSFDAMSKLTVHRDNCQAKGGVKDADDKSVKDKGAVKVADDKSVKAKGAVKVADDKAVKAKGADDKSLTVEPKESFEKVEPVGMFTCEWCLLTFPTASDWANHEVTCAAKKARATEASHPSFINTVANCTDNTINNSEEANLFILPPEESEDDPITVYRVASDGEGSYKNGPDNKTDNDDIDYTDEAKANKAVNDVHSSRARHGNRTNEARGISAGFYNKKGQRKKAKKGRKAKSARSKKNTNVGYGQSVQGALPLDESRADDSRSSGLLKRGRRKVSKTKLVSHPKLNTRGVKCQHCKQVFSTVKTLRNHMGRHDETRPFKCDTCGYRFKQAPQLTAHLRLHTGERPYTCSVTGCDAAFPQLSSLQNHIKSRHTSQSCLEQKVARTFRCRLCSRTFVTLASLNLHVCTGHKDEPVGTANKSKKKSNVNKSKKKSKGRGRKRSLSKKRPAVDVDTDDHSKDSDLNVNVTTTRVKTRRGSLLKSSETVSEATHLSESDTSNESSGVLTRRRLSLRHSSQTDLSSETTVDDDNVSTSSGQVSDKNVKLTRSRRSTRLSLRKPSCDTDTENSLEVGQDKIYDDETEDEAGLCGNQQLDGDKSDLAEMETNLEVAADSPSTINSEVTVEEMTKNSLLNSSGRITRSRMLREGSNSAERELVIDTAALADGVEGNAGTANPDLVVDESNLESMACTFPSLLVLVQKSIMLHSRRVEPTDGVMKIACQYCGDLPDTIEMLHRHLMKSHPGEYGCKNTVPPPVSLNQSNCQATELAENCLQILPVVNKGDLTKQPESEAVSANGPDLTIHELNKDAAEQLETVEASNQSASTGTDKAEGGETGMNKFLPGLSDRINTAEVSQKTTRKGKKRQGGKQSGTSKTASTKDIGGQLRVGKRCHKRSTIPLKKSPTRKSSRLAADCIRKAIQKRLHQKQPPLVSSPEKTETTVMSTENSTEILQHDKLSATISLGGNVSEVCDEQGVSDVVSTKSYEPPVSPSSMQTEGNVKTDQRSGSCDVEQEEAGDYIGEGTNDITLNRLHPLSMPADVEETIKPDTNTQPDAAPEQQEITAVCNSQLVSESQDRSETCETLEDNLEQKSKSRDESAEKVCTEQPLGSPPEHESEMLSEMKDQMPLPSCTLPYGDIEKHSEDRVTKPDSEVTEEVASRGSTPEPLSPAPLEINDITQQDTTDGSSQFGDLNLCFNKDLESPKDADNSNQFPVDNAIPNALSPKTAENENIGQHSFSGSNQMNDSPQCFNANVETTRIFEESIHHTVDNTTSEPVEFENSVNELNTVQESDQLSESADFQTAREEGRIPMDNKAANHSAMHQEVYHQSELGDSNSIDDSAGSITEDYPCTSVPVTKEKSATELETNSEKETAQSSVRSNITSEETSLGHRDLKEKKQEKTEEDTSLPAGQSLDYLTLTEKNTPCNEDELNNEVHRPVSEVVPELNTEPLVCEVPSITERDLSETGNNSCFDRSQVRNKNKINKDVSMQNDNDLVDITRPVTRRRASAEVVRKMGSQKDKLNSRRARGKSVGSTTDKGKQAPKGMTQSNKSSGKTGEVVESKSDESESEVIFSPVTRRMAATASKTSNVGRQHKERTSSTSRSSKKSKPVSKLVTAGNKSRKTTKSKTASSENLCLNSLVTRSARSRSAAGHKSETELNPVSVSDSTEGENPVQSAQTICVPEPGMQVDNKQANKKVTNNTALRKSRRTSRQRSTSISAQSTRSCLEGNESDRTGVSSETLDGKVAMQITCPDESVNEHLSPSMAINEDASMLSVPSDRDHNIGSDDLAQTQETTTGKPFLQDTSNQLHSSSAKNTDNFIEQNDEIKSPSLRKRQTRSRCKINKPSQSKRKRQKPESISRKKSDVSNGVDPLLEMSNLNSPISPEDVPDMDRVHADIECVTGSVDAETLVSKNTDGSCKIKCIQTGVSKETRVSRLTGPCEAISIEREILKEEEKNSTRKNNDLAHTSDLISKDTSVSDYSDISTDDRRLEVSHNVGGESLINPDHNRETINSDHRRSSDEKSIISGESRAGLRDDGSHDGASSSTVESAAGSLDDTSDQQSEESILEYFDVLTGKYRCKHCEREQLFSQPCSFRSHLNWVHGMGTLSGVQQNPTCPICRDNKEYEHQSALQCHMKWVHGVPIPTSSQKTTVESKPRVEKVSQPPVENLTSPSSSENDNIVSTAGRSSEGIPREITERESIVETDSVEVENPTDTTVCPASQNDEDNHEITTANVPISSKYDTFPSNILSSENQKEKVVEENCPQSPASNYSDTPPVIDTEPYSVPLPESCSACDKLGSNELAVKSVLDHGCPPCRSQFWTCAACRQSFQMYRNWKDHVDQYHPISSKPKTTEDENELFESDDTNPRSATGQDCSKQTSSVPSTSSYATQVSTSPSVTAYPPSPDVKSVWKSKPGKSYNRKHFVEGRKPLWKQTRNKSYSRSQKHVFDDRDDIFDMTVSDNKARDTAEDDQSDDNTCQSPRPPSNTAPVSADSITAHDFAANRSKSSESHGSPSTGYHANKEQLQEENKIDNDPVSTSDSISIEKPCEDLPDSGVPSAPVANCLLEEQKRCVDLESKQVCVDALSEPDSHIDSSSVQSESKSETAKPDLTNRKNKDTFKKTLHHASRTIITTQSRANLKTKAFHKAASAISKKSKKQTKVLKGDMVCCNSNSVSPTDPEGIERKRSDLAAKHIRVSFRNLEKLKCSRLGVRPHRVSIANTDAGTLSKLNQGSSTVTSSCSENESRDTIKSHICSDKKKMRETVKKGLREPVVSTRLRSESDASKQERNKRLTEKYAARCSKKELHNTKVRSLRLQRAKSASKKVINVTDPAKGETPNDKQQDVSLLDDQTSLRSKSANNRKSLPSNKSTANTNKPASVTPKPAISESISVEGGDSISKPVKKPASHRTTADASIMPLLRLANSPGFNAVQPSLGQRSIRACVKLQSTKDDTPHNLNRSSSHRKTDITRTERKRSVSLSSTKEQKTKVQETTNTVDVATVSKSKVGKDDKNMPALKKSKVIKVTVVTLSQMVKDTDNVEHCPEVLKTRSSSRSDKKSAESVKHSLTETRQQGTAEEPSTTHTTNLDHDSTPHRSLRKRTRTIDSADKLNSPAKVRRRTSLVGGLNDKRTVSNLTRSDGGPQSGVVKSDRRRSERMPRRSLTATVTGKRKRTSSR